MDGKSNRATEAGDHIWLSYTTQFTTGGRTHMLEMSVPIPVGASPELRERLLREAEEGMSHLVSHVEQRIPHILQHAQSPGTPPLVRSQPPRPANKPAAFPAPQTMTQGHERLPAQPTTAGSTEALSPSRLSISASMPVSPAPAGEGSSTLSLPEFIQYIKSSLGLDPKQAMQMLKVKTLSGINLREALEQLKAMKKNPTNEVDVNASHGAEPNIAHEQEAPYTLARSTSRAPQAVEYTIENDENEAMGEEDDEGDDGVYNVRPVHAFDEEVGPDDEELEDLEEDMMNLSPEEIGRARDLISKLREARGATTASARRLQALHNVVDTQIDKQQLKQLTEELWGVSALNKLKVDQLESLISWAKEDDFVNEVEAVLLVLEEERYARGNR